MVGRWTTLSERDIQRLAWRNDTFGGRLVVLTFDDLLECAQTPTPISPGGSQRGPLTRLPSTRPQEKRARATADEMIRLPSQSPSGLRFDTAINPELESSAGGLPSQQRIAYAATCGVCSRRNQAIKANFIWR
ncbi:hypothetical protein GCM10009850_111230 [Nonomuraea monospora]|uniref:Uncharacterized protein n=1 Tax=Nonomuraea monospora TaxID=568818 RepID=A0ABN3D1H8_9ACTN